ncbi:MAG TPA: Rv3235 family protein, partial [Streptosporangiaceae bacterium]
MLSLDTHLVQVPDTAPPYDCDLHGTACQSPRDGLPPGRLPGGALPGGALAGGALAGGGSPVAGERVAPLGRPAPGPPSPLASCAGAAWPRQFAQAIVETLAGTRPVRQLTPWTTERALAHIQTLCPLFRSDSGPR